MTVTKRDLVLSITKKLGHPQLLVQDVVQAVFDRMFEALARGDKIELRGFGVFEVKVRKARVGRNPHQPEKDIPIPARAVVRFKPGKDLREAVLKLTPSGTNPPSDAPSAA
ncbi:integration host factor subunit beta [Limisphaera ngatamarikiensis]|jgi:DNA-binding protein HU-beta/integration host factor subunit alpha|uniref:Integration host factor subunit beta n=1 Tax=Limisphaera ngatamarikiensis TaxID=1324935 RepID=A0A6M1RKF7_9BACT|nr:HU family DNA-binding protein [Limisphaera ngatamarikiensis]NGO38079.1 integration host factor subunit beta [Limisphaera ngatamarikiensis]